MKRAAVTTARILQAAGVDFGILGTRESCCGESIRKTGREDLWKQLARDNVKAFIDAGVRRIVVASPHCYHAFKNEYPELMVRFEVVHMSQFLLGLIEQGRLALGGCFPRRVAYHDPCYLGRHNGIYDEPRALLGRVPGLDPVELPEARQASLCCGGGGGRIWMDTPAAERFAGRRLIQARDAGAEVLATACPYCIANFEDARLALGEDAPAVRDLAEIVAEALATDATP
jgi:Fe-S oxidoreductase